jgi:hypothetical protein
MKKNTIGIICGAAAAILIAGMLSVTSSRPVNATPAFAGATGKPCGFCHQNPGGGGALNSAGSKFKANGNKL